MTGMQPIPTEVSEWRLRVANVVHDVFSSFFSSDRLSRTSKNGESGDETTTRGSRGLETSRWAPQNANASANVSKTNASRPNTCVSSGRRLEDSRWAPKQVVQRSRPAVRGLEDSMWASRVDTKKGTEVKGKGLAPSESPAHHSSSLPFTSFTSFTFDPSSLSSTKPQPLSSHSLLSSPSSSSSRVYSNDTRISSNTITPHTSPNKPVIMFRPANVDDTAGFMAAARARNQSSQVTTSAVVQKASSDQEIRPEPSTSFIGNPIAPEFVPLLPSSLAGNHGGSQGDAWTPAPKKVPGRKGTFSPVGSPTAPEFVPSSSSSLAGNVAGSQNGLSPTGSKISSFVGNPSAEEFVPSKPSSLVGNPVVEDALSVSVSKKGNNTADRVSQEDCGPDSFGSKPQLAIPMAAPSKEPATVISMDDTAGFMAAVRALNQSRNVSTVSCTTAVEQNPDLMNVVDDNSEPKQPTELPVVSPARHLFTPSPSKAEREPIVGFTTLDTEVSAQSIQPSNEPPNFEERPSTSFETINADDTAPIVVPPSIEGYPATPSSEKPANVDDTAAFMAAARRLRRTPAGDTGESTGTALDAVKSQANWLNSLSPVKEDLRSLDVYNVPQLMIPVQSLKRAEIGHPSMSPTEHFVSASSSPAVKTNNDLNGSANSYTVTVSKQEPAVNGFSAASNGIDTARSLSTTDNSNNPEPEAPKEKIAISVNDTAGFLAAVRALKERNRSPSISYTNAAPHERRPSNEYCSATRAHPSITAVEDEDRENLITFKSWGTPAPRDKPPSQVRRIILTGLPPSWAIPTKVLSLIHGGAIEKVNIDSFGNAYVYFCDHEACKAFYEKYPNGIGLGQSNVYVEIGQEVDVVSSQLTLSRSIGATRVVRAVGVDLKVTMDQLHQIATGSNRKIEKITDNYVPGEARTVNFRFCSIDDANKFRAMLVRDVEWEHCNIQYGKDPCELASGFHMD